MDRDLFKSIRYFKGMNQVDFAKWLGVSTPTVALFEAGHRPMSEATRAKLAHKFDITDAEFIEYRERRKNLKGSK